LYNKLLFVHAILGCDTISQPFGIGKGKALKMLKRKRLWQKLLITFTQSGLSRQDIITLGEEARFTLWWLRGEKLNCLRYSRCFCEKVARSSNHVELQILPPTAAASKFTVHVFIIKYKNGRGVQIWILRNISGKYQTICCSQL